MNEETNDNLKQINGCVIIPTYNNEKTLAGVIRDVKRYTPHIIVVNDGSTDSTSTILQSFPDITCCEYLPNKGKGFALQTGFKEAIKQGFESAITIDSDGQHFASDIPLFIEKTLENHGSLLIGCRNLHQDNMPGKNTFANKFSNFWYLIETGQRLNDTQSGFRLYPVRKIANTKYFTQKYDFELEVLVRSAWKSIPVLEVPIQVYYAPEGERVSHFKPLKDFTRISLLNTVLVIVAFLWIKPCGFVRKLNKENIKRFFHEQVLASSDSNTVIAGSIALGIFMGIVPVWGYQMLIAFGLAHWLKLNKVITLVASNISVPPMIPFILFGSFATGAWILRKPLSISVRTVSFEAIGQELMQYIIGSCALAAVCSLAIGLSSFILLSVVRKK